MISGKKDPALQLLNTERPTPIPDFCRWRRLLALVVVVQALAVVFTLLIPGEPMVAAVRLVLITAYLQLICVLSAAGLCLLRRRLAGHGGFRMFTAAWMFIVMVAALVSFGGYDLSRELLDPAFLPEETRASFVQRNSLIAALLGALLLRYFSARAQWEENVLTESEARYQSLSARIRPHFLFNSLNSIAALIPVKPAAAETMVEDLADVFRASLTKGDVLIDMAEEIDLVRKFARIEQTRLGARLGVDWDIPEAVMPLSIPRLTIQPLVENAVHHGAAQTRGPVTIIVRARVENDLLVVEVVNPAPPDDNGGHAGTQTAVSNIAQRVRLLYGARASLTLTRQEGNFCARLQLPARQLDTQ